MAKTLSNIYPNVLLTLYTMSLNSLDLTRYRIFLLHVVFQQKCTLHLCAAIHVYIHVTLSIGKIMT